jgi:copper transport protein
MGRINAGPVRRAAAPAVVLAVGLAAVPGAAHTPLAASSPRDGAVLAAAPPFVTATYAEPLGAVRGAVVSAPGGDRTVTPRLMAGDRRRVRVPVPSAGAGAYRVTWVAVSADGHASEATVAFRVRPPAVAVTLLRVSVLVRAAGATVARRIDRR